MPDAPNPVRPEPVEGQAPTCRRVRGFDKLSPNGDWSARTEGPHSTLSAVNPWLALCALLAAGALLSFFLFPPSLLDGQPGRWLRQPWRLWTAAWVHWTPLHLAANAAGVAALALYGQAAGVERRHALAWLAAWPLTHALLAAWGPAGMDHYGGLSGVLHAGAAVASTALLARAGLLRRVGAAVWAGLLLKLGLESPWSPWPVAAGWDFSVATQAHAAGALAGALCALAVEMRRARERRPARPGRRPAGGPNHRSH